MCVCFVHVCMRFVQFLLLIGGKTMGHRWYLLGQMEGGFKQHGITIILAQWIYGWGWSREGWGRGCVRSHSLTCSTSWDSYWDAQSRVGWEKCNTLITFSTLYVSAWDSGSLTAAAAIQASVSLTGSGAGTGVYIRVGSGVEAGMWRVADLLFLISWIART